MSVGPPEDYFDDAVTVDEAARPTRPSERGAWRHHWAEDDHDPDDEATERLGANRSPGHPPHSAGHTDQGSPVSE